MVDILFLFEKTGLAAQPFEQLGFKTCCIDKAKPLEAPNRVTLAWDILEKESEIIQRFKGVRLIIGFPPCTDLAVSGATHFAAKRAKDADFQIKALHLFKSVERIATAIGAPWCAENPRSVVSTMWRKPNFSFEPYHYGGYLPEDDIHPYWPAYIAPRDAYPKTTYLWAGNGFKLPPIKKVQPELGYSRQHKYLGGKSEFTKTVRSASPRGFFTALALLTKEEIDGHDH